MSEDQDNNKLRDFMLAALSDDIDFPEESEINPEKIKAKKEKTLERKVNVVEVIKKKSNAIYNQINSYIASKSKKTKVLAITGTSLLGLTALVAANPDSLGSKAFLEATYVETEMFGCPVYSFYPANNKAWIMDKNSPASLRERRQQYRKEAYYWSDTIEKDGRITYREALKGLRSGPLDDCWKTRNQRFGDYDKEKKKRSRNRK